MNRPTKEDKITLNIIIKTIYTWTLVGMLLFVEYIFFIPFAILLTLLFDRKDKKIIFYLTKLFIKFFFFFYFTGKFNFDFGKLKKASTPRIYILNHASQFDTFLMYLLPGRIKVFVKSNYVKVPFIGWTIKLSGNILVKKPADIYESNSVIDEGIVELRSGASILIFPEGTKSKTGDINRFKIGSFRLAYETKAEIIPVVLDSWNGIRPGGFWIRDDKVHLKVLAPISYEQYKDIEERDFARILRCKMSEELLKIRDERRIKDKKYYRKERYYLELDNNAKLKIEEFKSKNKFTI